MRDNVALGKLPDVESLPPEIEMAVVNITQCASGDGVVTIQLSKTGPIASCYIWRLLGQRKLLTSRPLRFGLSVFHSIDFIWSSGITASERGEIGLRVKSINIVFCLRFGLSFLSTFPSCLVTYPELPVS